MYCQSVHIVFLVLLVQTSAVSASSSMPSAVPEFGHDMLRLFAMDSNYTNLNHGSYGAPPKQVLNAAQAYELDMEKNPDNWFRFTVYDMMDAVRKVLAKFVGADADDVAFVPNASHGVNAVLRSLRIKPGEKSLFLNVAYTMVKNTLKYLEEFDHDSLLQVNITLPGSNTLIVEAVRQALEDNAGRVKVASLSHIVSLPGFILPIKELTDLCHAHGVLVLIDGAHALGQIPLNLNELNADFWVGNGHKWLFSPKGSAILWVPKKNQHLVEPTTISWEGVGATHFQAAFAYQGTSSYSPYLAMADAVAFRESIGGEEKIHKYMHSLAVETGKKMASAFGTEVLFSDDSRYASMVDVRLPSSDGSLIQPIPKELMKQFNTYVPVYGIESLGGEKGKYYVRVSLQIYNEISDIEYLIQAIQQLLKKDTV